MNDKKENGNTNDINDKERQYEQHKRQNVQQTTLKKKNEINRSV